MGKIEAIADEVERALRDKRRPEREVPSSVIGELVMEKLHGLDEVAYVRFASVYRQFKDARQFMREAEKVRRSSTFKTLFKKR